MDGTSSPLSRGYAGAALVFLQPSSGWPATVKYSNFHWDGTDSFAIYGPAAGAKCGWYNPLIIPFVADVRPGDNSPEIIISCYGHGENSYGSIYGLYENKKYFGGWKSSIDLNTLN